MSVTATYLANLTAVEVLETNVPAASSAAKKQVTHDGFNTTATLNSGTTPAATKVAAFEKALTDGAASIDLTALTGTNGAAVNGTGLKVQALKIRNPATNSYAITVAEGLTNGYNGLGTSFSLALEPGAEAVVLTADGGSDIGAANKTLDLSGTGSESAQLIIIMG